MSWDWDKLNNQYVKKEKKPFELKAWMGITAYVILALVMIFTFWNIARWANYKFSYEHKYEQKIIEMVKPEALKEKYKKEAVRDRL